MSSAAKEITRASSSSARRGQPIPPQSIEYGYDQAWYPIALSSELIDGKVLSAEWMNGRVIAIRDAQGRAHVLSAFCRHLGADLAGGELIDGTVRCPYHHWRYDTQGQCVATAFDRAPPAAKLFRFPVHEGLGFVWAFNGNEPLFDPPSFALPESKVHLRARAEDLLNCDHFVPFSNSCDIQHLKAVHGMQLEINPEDMKITPLSIEYVQDQIAPGMGKLRLHIHMIGTNTLILTGETMGRPMYMMSTSRSLPGNRTQIYQSVATPRRDAPGDEQMAAAMIEQALKFGRQLMDEDVPIINRISFRQDVLTHSDRVLAKYFDWVRAYPRSSIACDYIAP
jgi:nitrite reductase/ring-hydroxylating ferredoxin subunit